MLRFWVSLRLVFEHDLVFWNQFNFIKNDKSNPAGSQVLKIDNLTLAHRKDAKYAENFFISKALESPVGYGYLYFLCFKIACERAS